MKTSLDKAIEIIHRLTKPQEEIIHLPPTTFPVFHKPVVVDVEQALSDAAGLHDESLCPYEADALKWRKQQQRKKEYMARKRREGK